MKSLSLSVAIALAGVVSSFAGTTVWSFDKKTGNDMQPAYWYSYQDSSTQTYGVVELTTEGYRQFSATLNLNLGAGKTSATGFGFAWKQVNRKDVAVDLSTYSGLCLTYKAEKPFRVDFKQENITNYNFHGMVLPAQEDFTPTFIDFTKIAQENWGDDNVVALDLKQQLAVQMSYKTGIAEELEGADRNKNVITVSAVSLGECETTPPPVTEGLKVLEPYDKVQQVTIAKTDSLKITLSKVFSADENETVTITTTTTGGVLDKVQPTGAASLSDVLIFAPKDVGKDTSAAVVILARSNGKSVMAQLNVKITNESSDPICPGDPRCKDDPPVENKVTTVLPPYNVDAVTLDSIFETDTLKFALDKMFADEDDDSIYVAVDASAHDLVQVLTMTEKKLFIKDTLRILTRVKKDTSIILAVYASDGKSDPVSISFVVNVKNLNRAPVAVDTAYVAKEDEPLLVAITNGIAAIASDPDGDDFGVVLIDSTKHGKLSDFTLKGGFVYTPELNFHGDDTLTYVLIETDDRTVKSQKGIVVIHVQPVNDAPVFTIADSTFLKDTLALDMNFDEDTVSQIKIPTKSLVFSDLEVSEGTQKLTYKAAGTKIVAAVDSVNASFYFISVKPVENASGTATIFLYATDGVDSAGVKIGVRLISPKDVAQAVKDEYIAFNDTVLSVSAKDGVLANDTYPEGVTKGMTAELAQKPSHGTLTLNKDGSFKYTPTEGYEGPDLFGYYCVINETKSKPGIVSISVEKRNSLPNVVVKASSLDTTVAEDFPSSRALKYPKSVVSSWFKDPEGDPLTFTAESKDGKLKVAINDAGTLEVNSAPDSTGKAYVVVTATDKKSGSKSFEFCVTITAVNDKPKLLRDNDTAYVSKTDWKVKWDLDTLVTDVDGDELTYTPNETSALSKYVTLSMKGSVLTVKSVEGVKYTEGKLFAIGVKVSDPGKANVTIPLYVVIGKKPNALQPVLAQPKNTWQNAVTAKRGTVSIMDMQGRSIWSAKLPVDPAEVKNASAQVQGRKILRVNNQTWTIK